MKTRYLTKTTEELNQLNLPNGHLAVDSEKKALRFYDGAIAGGYEMIGTRAIELISGPGPAELIAGDSTDGFYGEVGPEEFISYGDLSTAAGVSAGNLQHDLESLWLKYSLDGKTLFLAKKPVKNDINWTALYQAGCVYGVDGVGQYPINGGVNQLTTVEIGGFTFKVRLLKGLLGDTTTVAGSWDGVETHGSEWNRLMYPVHSGIHTYASNPNPHTDPTAVPFGSWAQYTDDDLITRYQTTGGRCWVQETLATSTGNRMQRGYAGVTYIGNDPVNNLDFNYRGWRPVLELIT